MSATAQMKRTCGSLWRSKAGAPLPAPSRLRAPCGSLWRSKAGAPLPAPSSLRTPSGSMWRSKAGAPFPAPSRLRAPCGSLWRSKGGALPLPSVLLSRATARSNHGGLPRPPVPPACYRLARSQGRGGTRLVAVLAPCAVLRFTSPPPPLQQLVMPQGSGVPVLTRTPSRKWCSPAARSRLAPFLSATRCATLCRCPSRWCSRLVWSVRAAAPPHPCLVKSVLHCRALS